AAAPATGGRGALRPHGGNAVPAHRAVRPLAAGPDAGVVHVRPTRTAGLLRPQRDRPRATLTAVPLTFPSHAGVVVPLKLWRPRWFDGVALVLGSTAPDLPYAIHRYAEIRAHTWWGLVWFCVPVTMLGCVAVRWAVAVTAAHLPMGGPLRLRDYGGLRDVRHPLLVTAFSAWLGALSHRLWDVVTHASIDQGT